LFAKIVRVKFEQILRKFLKEKLNVENVPKKHLDLSRKNKRSEK
tara:strand:+ start:243 stop:374 length:132 start_codon:yes stop_codon:yes gene_type:complete